MLSGRGQPFKRCVAASAIDSAASVVASAGVSQAEIRLRALRTTGDKKDHDGATESTLIQRSAGRNGQSERNLSYRRVSISVFSLSPIYQLVTHAA
jgi:hypothetical protein